MSRPWRIEQPFAYGDGVNEILDYSVAVPTAAEIRAAGYLGSMRYLGYDDRCVKRPEIDGLHAEGLGVGFVWETSASRAATGGYEGGHDDAGRAHVCLMELGVPPHIPVFYACDQDMTTGNQAAILDYFRGVHDVTEVLLELGTGHAWEGYGEADLMDVLYRFFGREMGWQSGAWSNRRVSDHACMYQQIGYVMNDRADRNTVLKPVTWLWFGGEEMMAETKPGRCVYKFPEGHPDPWAGTLLIDFRDGAYPAPGGVAYGPHFYLTNAQDEYDQLVAGKQINPDAVRTFATGDDALDAVWEKWPHIPAGTQFTYAAPSGNVDTTALVEHVADVLAHRLAP